MVKEECHDTYPIRVKVVMEKDGKQTQLFEADQRNLFSKYADKRQQSIQDIQTAVTKAI